MILLKLDHIFGENIFWFSRAPQRLVLVWSCSLGGCWAWFIACSPDSSSTHIHNADGHVKITWRRWTSAADITWCPVNCGDASSGRPLFCLQRGTLGHTCHTPLYLSWNCSQCVADFPLLCSLKHTLSLFSGVKLILALLKGTKLT